MCVIYYVLKKFNNIVLPVAKECNLVFKRALPKREGGDTLAAIHALTHAASAGGSADFKILTQPLPKSTTSAAQFSPQIMYYFTANHSLSYIIHRKSVLFYSTITAYFRSYKSRIFHIPSLKL